MTDLEIIKQLMNGNHLEEKELQRAEDILTGLNNALTTRY